MLQLLIVAAFPILVIIGALRDLSSFTIPNWISGALILAFFPAALACGLSPGQIGISLGVGVVLLLVGMGMFAVGWIGGGDAKLLASASLWLGWPGAVDFVLFTAVAGGALAVGLMTARNTPLTALALRGPEWMHRLVEKDGPAPYGVAIAFGALAAFPFSHLAQGLTGAVA